MFHTIVVGTDGSDRAQRAVAAAAQLAAATGSRLAVVNAYQPVLLSAALAVATTAPGGPSLPIAELEDEQHRQALERVEHAVMRLPVPVPRVEQLVRCGEAAEVLISVAEELNADVIVVGSRGMTGGARFLIGSVPNRVAHHAGRNVFIVQTD